MSGKDYLHIWYLAQLTVVTFLLLLICAWEAVHGIVLVYRMIPVTLITVIGLVTTSWNAAPTWLKVGNRWLQAIVQPVILIVVWGFVTRSIIVRLQLPARGVVALTMLYYLVMFAPFASEIGGQLKWAASRIFCLFWWFNIVVFGMDVALPQKFMGPHTFVVLISSGAAGALAFFLLVTTVMRTWELSWPGLKPRFSWDVSWWVIAILLIVAAALIIWNAYGTGDHWYNVLFSYYFSWHTPSKMLTAKSFEAAVGEESLVRFGFLGACLYAMRNWKNRVCWAVIVSSLLFGLMHYFNLFDQHFDMTTVQAINAFLLGLFLSVVYLYTGQLWLTMLIHFLFDWTAFTVSGTSTMAGHTNYMDWLTLLIEFIVLGGITAWMMFGNRRHVMERHANKLIGEDQHFGFRLDFN